MLSDEPKVQCLGSRAGEPTCAVMNTIVLVTIFLLALGAAGIATPRTRNALLKRMPWFTSSAWVSAMFWLVVRHVDSWTRPVAPLVALGRRGHLVMTGSPWRHVELALTCAVGVAFTVVALSDDQSPEWRPIVMAAIAHMLAGSILLGSHWHYLGTLYQRYTHVHFAAALVLTVVLYVLALSASIIMLRPRWAVGVYYRTTCPKRGNVITPVGWLGSLILRVDPSLATLKNATAVAFYGSVLAFCICALMNLDVHATTSLGVIVSVGELPFSCAHSRVTASGLRCFLWFGIPHAPQQDPDGLGAPAAFVCNSGPPCVSCARFQSLSLESLPLFQPRVTFQGHSLAVFVMRHTKQRHVMVAADAADDALTPNVTHELLRRAFDFGMHPALRQSHGAALARPTAVVTQSFNPKLKDSSRLHKSSANDGFTRMTGRVTNVADVSSFEQDSEWDPLNAFGGRALTI